MNEMGKLNYKPPVTTDTCDLERQRWAKEYFTPLPIAPTPDP
jgi:hypothetical protein